MIENYVTGYTGVGGIGYYIGADQTFTGNYQGAYIGDYIGGYVAPSTYVGPTAYYDAGAYVGRILEQVHPKARLISVATLTGGLGLMVTTVQVSISTGAALRWLVRPVAILLQRHGMPVVTRTPVETSSRVTQAAYSIMSQGQVLAGLMPEATTPPF